MKSGIVLDGGGDEPRPSEAPVSVADDARDAWRQLVDGVPGTAWVTFRYAPAPAGGEPTLVLRGAGGGDMAELIRTLGDDAEIVFGAFRVNSYGADDGAGLAFFHYNAPNAPAVARARAPVHANQAQAALGDGGLVTARFQLDELSEAVVLAKVKLMFGLGAWHCISLHSGGVRDPPVLSCDTRDWSFRACGFFF